MVKRRFPPDDPLLLDVVKAYDAMHALTVRLHYLACEGGVGDIRGTQGKAHSVTEQAPELEPPAN
jgi:hypothetical protein